MSRIRDRLTIVGRIITSVVPQVRSGWTYTAHSASMPACWEMETAEGIFLLTESVLLLPDDPALSTLLDIWAIGAPMATSNSPTYGQSNSSMQDERIMRHRR